MCQDISAPVLLHPRTGLIKGVHQLERGSGRTARRTAAREGARAQAVGRSRGGPTTKVHVLADVLGRPAVVHLTTGSASDVKSAPEVIAAAPGRVRRLLAGRGCDADPLRRNFRAAGITPVIPGRRTRRRPVRHDARRCKGRRSVEAAICRLKDFRRVATRRDKPAADSASAGGLTAAVVAFGC